MFSFHSKKKIFQIIVSNKLINMNNDVTTFISFSVWNYLTFCDESQAWAYWSSIEHTWIDFKTDHQKCEHQYFRILVATIYQYLVLLKFWGKPSPIKSHVALG